MLNYLVVKIIPQFHSIVNCEHMFSFFIIGLQHFKKVEPNHYLQKNVDMVSDFAYTYIKSQMKDGEKMNQNGLVDVRAHITQYEHELEELLGTVATAQRRIKDLQQTIVHAETKATEVRNIINVCKKLLGESQDVNIDASHVDAGRKQSLPSLIKTMLDANPGRSFTVADISEKLAEQGYQTKSDHFRIVVRNTLRRMAANEILKVREDGQNKLYCSSGQEGDSLLK